MAAVAKAGGEIAAAHAGRRPLRALPQESGTESLKLGLAQFFDLWQFFDSNLNGAPIDLGAPAFDKINQINDNITKSGFFDFIGMVVV